MHRLYGTLTVLFYCHLLYHHGDFIVANFSKSIRDILPHPLTAPSNLEFTWYSLLHCFFLVPNDVIIFSRDFNADSGPMGAPTHQMSKAEFSLGIWSVGHIHVPLLTYISHNPPLTIIL